MYQFLVCTWRSCVIRDATELARRKNGGVRETMVFFKRPSTSVRLLMTVGTGGGGAWRNNKCEPYIPCLKQKNTQRVCSWAATRIRPSWHHARVSPQPWTQPDFLDLTTSEMPVKECQAPLMTLQNACHREWRKRQQITNACSSGHKKIQ